MYDDFLDFDLHRSWCAELTCRRHSRDSVLSAFLPSRLLFKTEACLQLGFSEGSLRWNCPCLLKHSYLQ